MNGHDLSCAGRSKFDGHLCSRPPVWAIGSPPRLTWAGACSHHLHQVMKNTAGQVPLQVLPASLLRDGTVQVDTRALLREMITHRGGTWTWTRVRGVLREMGHLRSGSDCRRLLELLEEDEFLARVGGDARTPQFRQVNDQEWTTLGRSLTLLLAVRDDPGIWTRNRALRAFREHDPHDPTTTPEQVERDLLRLRDEGQLVQIAHDQFTLPVLIPENANQGTPTRADSAQ